MSRVVSMITFLVSLLFSQITYANDCNIKIADMNWGSATLMANVDKLILERGYDCKVDLVVGDTVPTFTAMMNKGTPDLAPELWASTVTTLLEKAEQEGLFMIESFLMGVSIEDVRERYSDEIIQQPEETNEEETEQAGNVLSFRPKQ